MIGTTDITLSDGSTLRIPRVGWFGADGTNMEGTGVRPDILVVETPEDLAAGRDPQLEKAIEVLLAKLAGPPDTVQADPSEGDDTAKAVEQKDQQTPKNPKKPRK